MLVRFIALINLCLSIFSYNEPVIYNSESRTLDGMTQHVHTLEVDMNDPFVTVRNALSFSKIYGFEETSVMVNDNEAVAGINGTFYTIYGHHLGLLVKDGEIATMAKDYSPVVAFLESGDVYIGDMNTEVKVRSESSTVIVDTMNDAAFDEKWVLYSNIYGNTTRITRKSINYIIDNNKIVDKVITDDPIDITEGSYILSRVTDNPDIYDLFDVDDEVQIEIVYNPDKGKIREAFQTGGWLVKDSINVAKDYEPLMGNTGILNPRTILGVTKDNRIIMKVVDGRQPNYSYGITGKTCAEIMLEEGCINAVYLDGGASSTMVYNEKVVNSPSMNTERKVAHSIIVDYDRNDFLFMIDKIKDMVIDTFNYFFDFSLN